jgi:uncharacterized membrane protein YkoI
MRLLRFSALMTAVAVAPAAWAGEAGRCFETWSEAAIVVMREGLVAIERLASIAGSRLGGEIVKSTLCHDGSRYVYRLIVRPPAGQLRIFSLDARMPFDSRPADR